MLAAGDTFRAGAIDQLKVWGERVGVDVISKVKVLIQLLLCMMRLMPLKTKVLIF